MGKIRITTQQAAEFIELGYTVEMWVQVDKQENNKTNRRKPSHKIMIPQEAIIGLRVSCLGPVKGAYGKVWEKVRQVLWQDPLVTHTRSAVEMELRAAGNTDSSMFAYLIRSSKCLRVMPNQSS